MPNKPRAPLTAKQIDDRLSDERRRIGQRFPGLVFCLVIAQPNQKAPGTQSLFCATNTPGADMRSMLRTFARHHEDNEKLLNNPEGTA